MKFPGVPLILITGLIKLPGPNYWTLNVLTQKAIFHPKIFFPHILKSGDSSSTKVFHGEHFSAKSLTNITSYSLSTNVDIEKWGIRY